MTAIRRAAGVGRSRDNGLAATPREIAEPPKVIGAGAEEGCREQPQTREGRPRPASKGASTGRTGGRGKSSASLSPLTAAKTRAEPYRDVRGFSAGGTTWPSPGFAPIQRPSLSQRSRPCHPGSAARRISIHSGVAPGRLASSSRASAFVWVTQGITAGASPSSGWQANSRRMPLGS